MITLPRHDDAGYCLSYVAVVQCKKGLDLSQGKNVYKVLLQKLLDEGKQGRGCNAKRMAVQLAAVVAVCWKEMPQHNKFDV